MPRAAIAASLLILAAMAAGLPSRHWDPDEFQHAQFAWLIAQGLTPYRDFFEHHPPLWHLLAAPAAALVDPTDPASAWRFLLAGRWVSLLCTAALAATTWALARRFAPPATAALAAVLVLGATFTIAKGVELRPDPLCALLLALSALALTRATAARCLLAGIAFGAAMLVSQKAVMAAPGLAIACLWRAGSPRALLPAAAVIPGAVLAALPVLAWFAAQGALPDLLDGTLLVNLSWPRDDHAALLRHLRLMAERDPVLILLALAGLATIRGPALRFLAPILAALAAGALALPVAQEQYLLLALPFAAILAALAAQPLLTRPAALAALALLLALTTARNLQAEFARPGAPARALLTALLEQTPPDATILAGWTPGFAFRRPAWRFFFLHEEIARVIPAADLAALESGLRAGTIRPAAVDADALTRLPSGIADLLRAGFAPSATPGLLLRK